MFAVVDIAGFQEIVKEGDTIKVPSLVHEEGKNVVFANIFLLSDGDTLTLGAPHIAGASVEAEVIADGRHDKIRVVKMRRRKRYRRVKGHHQGYTEIKVVKIVVK